MFRPLCNLPLPRLLSSKLRELGFMYCDDVCIDRNGKPILDPIAEKVLRQWSDEPCTYWKELLATPATKNAFSHLQDECDLGRIETFCRSLDEYMDGGVPLQRITEFSGAPGSGKTQMCLQLCVDVQIPRAFCGLEGQAVFVDTCSGFTVSRLSEIAEACVNHCSMLARDGLNQNMLQAMKHFSKISILENVFHVLCLTHVDLMASIIYLKKFLSKHKQVRLIVIDSITFPLQTIDNSLQRVSLLYDLMENLRTIASEFDVAVVVTNNLTTKVETGKESSLIPALGESFGHSVNYRFLLGRMSDSNFVCVSGKNLNKSSVTVPFQITRSGIREVQNN
ncbi:hypothetical protein R5R35_000773 [Gryllus longicercus]|uniref:DNA repair protein RAD51 homolog 3 n=1 Tax=Gryllus longicercus TaxID=2509291 RepID=A0AAN9VGP1_9ORTH